MKGFYMVMDYLKIMLTIPNQKLMLGISKEIQNMCAQEYYV